MGDVQHDIGRKCHISETSYLYEAKQYQLSPKSVFRSRIDGSKPRGRYGGNGIKQVIDEGDF